MAEAPAGLWGERFAGPLAIALLLLVVILLGSDQMVERVFRLRSMRIT